MSAGYFTEKKHEPTPAEIQAAIGACFPVWDGMVAFLRAKYTTQEDFKFMYGKNYGWALRFRIKGKLLTNLYPAKDGFTVQANLSPSAVEKAESMSLGQNVLDAIHRAHTYPEGRWVFAFVGSEQDADDLKRLLALRAEERRL